MSLPLAAWPGFASADPAIGSLRLGAVHLTVADLGRSLAYWTGVVGLQARPQGDGIAALHAGGPDLVVLVEQPGALPARGHAGLYHVALLVPSRRDLAHWFARAMATMTLFEGLADHGVSEAVYLRDPDHHGIEIYADRPPAAWSEDGMVTLQLDTASLLAEPPATPPPRTLPEGTTIGHVHLHVGDLTAADRFYGGALGLDRTMAVPGNAHFYAAGLYHHHLAGNLWAGSDVTQPPPGTAALRRVTVILPDVAQRDRVAARAADLGFEPVATPDGILLPDPSGNPLLLAV
ncbi:unannotated protein [freshwater metagenome]|uniref:Unannotated protein n=1 Tax=freshwater metagenome TaxID=449393 RepID=A0A6J7CSZ2_9ZZZZ|nr:hypothetical protein [Actinomycetota bacterium]